MNTAKMKFVISLIALLLGLLIFAMPAEASSWSGFYQTSVYGPYEGETTCATGKRITYSTKYVAVPMERIVSKEKWKRLSAKNKKQYFYYHEKLTLKHGNYTCVVWVEDCGGFGSYGGYYKGKWRKRMFDLQPAVKKALHVGGTDFVKFKY